VLFSWRTFWLKKHRDFCEYNKVYSTQAQKPSFFLFFSFCLFIFSRLPNYHGFQSIQTSRFGSYPILSRFLDHLAKPGSNSFNHITCTPTGLYESPWSGFRGFQIRIQLCSTPAWRVWHYNVNYFKLKI